ncbi:alpha-L-arabinofuranosidase C-terminal domain-containing protein [Methylomonas sp. HYX-M1]|uniref:alpha-L-arabinofuranosidase C-terminal domain-containing protein n=1 Tax=Methylomonas sp. HYX-M1 TaxID=3139307 RepID=UPI00345B59AE
MKTLTTIFLCVCLCFEYGSTTVLAAEQAGIVIDAQQSGRVIPRLLFGSNLQWEANGDGLIVSDNGQDSLVPAVVDTVKSAGVSAIRFPGGALSNTYQWQNAIGPLAERKVGVTYSGQPAPSNFGTDEFIRLCRLTGSDAVVTVNFSADPADAAHWVEYLNGSPQSEWGALRAKNGNRQALGVRYFEIGNEIYSPNEPGHTSASNYAARVKDFAKAMKTVDPSIKVGVALEASFTQAAWMVNVYPHLLSWNEQVIKHLDASLDFVVVHFYAPFDKMFFNNDLKRLVLAGPMVFAQNLASVKGLLATHQRDRMEIAVTEYNTFFGEKVVLDKRISSAESALFNAMMLFAMMRDDKVVLANHWSLLNNSSFGMLQYQDGVLLKRPNYDVMTLLSQMAQGSVLDTKVQSPAYSIDAKGNLPALAQVPYLDAIAVIGANKDLLLAVVNRGLEDSVPTAISWSGFSGTNGELITLIDDQDGGWTRNESVLAVSANRFNVSFPAQSLSLIRLKPSVR